MKKLFMIVFILLVVFVFPVPAEEPAGDWYGEANGLPVHLALGTDGAFTLSIPTQAPVTGDWVFNDGFVFLDGDGDNPLNLVNESLMVWANGGIIFTREAPEAYVPAEPWTDAPVILYSDYWKAAYADVAGTLVPAAALEDETDLYVEGYSALLGGPILGDVIVKLEEQGGVLATAAGSAPAATIVLQQDGLLCLTVTGSETAPQTWYLQRSYSPVLHEEEEEI